MVMATFSAEGKTLQEHLDERTFGHCHLNYWLDEDSRTVTFGLYEPYGKLKGLFTYKPGQMDKSVLGRESRYNPEVRSWHVANFLGMETLGKTRVLFVGEGLFDVTPFHALGFSALSAMGCMDKTRVAFLRNYENLHPDNVVVSVGDNDKSGEKFNKLFKRSFTPPAEYHDHGDFAYQDFPRFKESVFAYLRAEGLL